MNRLQTINWIDTKVDLNVLLQAATDSSRHLVDQGFEAEVAKFHTKGETFVLKVWNQSSKPGVRFQYHLLDRLKLHGIEVPTPFGWGLDDDENQVLLTSDNGCPVSDLTKDNMVEMARILSRIHRLTKEEIGVLQVPAYHFMDYFFPDVQKHSDLAQLLTTLTQVAQPKQSHLIHGDYHFQNIVQRNGQFTVIDWTNAQWGDARYDVDWAFLLFYVYASEPFADVFQSAYITNETVAELQPFKALACLRWVLLYRNGGVPVLPDTVSKVERFIKLNPFLKDSLSL
ncbi:aminoglycoside phosphotransferase family protein [Sporosarcina cyprini]|uniref:aminoglycoside phosphotransferase family protein n=1 Tax=Sporosarcina cyprini TaxID=2910523 RepID=UPI001EE07326|nr:aminoglycoside phosphotransferase family protein [Sporosarcina cyprini]MCG3089891.1 aminoglycoside phosphotransferase family protein [Sporosarcina cyprini]